MLLYACVKGWLIYVLARLFNEVELISFEPPVCVRDPVCLLPQDLITDYHKNVQTCVCASVCVSVSALLYSHQWNVCILSQTCLYSIRFMLLMWAFVHDVSQWVWAVAMVTQEIGRLKWWCHHTDRRYHFLDPKGKETLCQLDLLSEILTDVTEQDQHGAFPHSTAVLQQVQILQQDQTHTLETWIKWPMNRERTVFQASWEWYALLYPPIKEPLPSI